MAAVTEDDIRGYAEKYDVPPELALAVFSQESASGTNVKDSPRGAKGPMQVVDKTFAAQGVSDRTEAGVKYLAEAYNKTNSFEGAAAYYHAGPKWQQKIQENPDVGDGYIRTVDYAKSVAQKARKMTDTGTPDATSRVTDSPGTGDSTPSLAAVLDARDSPSLVDRGADLFKRGMDAADSLYTSSVEMKDKIKDNLSKQQDTETSIGQLSSTVELERFRQDQTRANRNAATLSRLDINDDDVNSIVANAALQMASDFKASSAMRDDINQRKNLNFVDDPIAWIQNQFTLNDDIAKHNQLVDRMAKNKKYMESASAFAENAGKANALKYASTTAAGAQAAADLQVAKAKEASLKIEAQKTKEDFDTQVRNNAAINNQIALNEKLKQDEINNGIRKDAAEVKRRKDQEQQDLDDQAKTAAQILGYKVSSFAELNKLDKATADSVKKVMMAGPDGNFSTGPLEASEILARGTITGPNKMTDSNVYMRGMLAEIRRQSETELEKDERFKAATRDERRAQLNQVMLKKFNEYKDGPTRSLSTSGDTNPYNRPSPETMETNGESANLKITKLLADARKTLGNIPVTDSLIASVALAGVGTVYSDISEAAKDVQEYYRSVVRSNNNTFRFDALGLPVQSNYRVEGTDYTDYKSVMKKLLRQYSTQQVGGIPGFEGIIPNVETVPTGGK